MLQADIPIHRPPRFIDYFAAVRSRIRQIVATGALLAILVILLASLAGPKEATYQASTDVLLQTGTAAPLSPATQARIAASLPVAERVQQKLENEITTRALLESTLVTQVPESEVLTITSEADDPDTAARVANLFAKEFLAVSTKETQTALDLRLVSLRDQIAFTERRLDRALKNEQTSRAQRNLLARELEELRAQANSVQLQREQDLGPGRVVAPAVPNGSPIARAMSPALLGAVAGITWMLLVLAFVLLREHFSDRVRSRSDVVHLLGTPLLGVLRESLEREHDEVRRLSNDLHNTMLRNEVRTLLVVRMPKQVKIGELVSRLATHLSEADRKVVVVEIGEKRPSDGPAAGTPVEYAPSPLTPPAAEKLVVELKSEWDTILINGPVATSADAASLGASADGILVVAGGGQVSQSQLLRAQEEFARTDTPVVGAVILESPRQTPLAEH